MPSTMMRRGFTVQWYFDDAVPFLNVSFAPLATARVAPGVANVAVWLVNVNVPPATKRRVMTGLTGRSVPSESIGHCALAAVVRTSPEMYITLFSALLLKAPVNTIGPNPRARNAILAVEREAAATYCGSAEYETTLAFWLL